MHRFICSTALYRNGDVSTYGWFVQKEGCLASATPWLDSQGRDVLAGAGLLRPAANTLPCLTERRKWSTTQTKDQPVKPRQTLGGCELEWLSDHVCKNKVTNFHVLVLWSKVFIGTSVTCSCSSWFISVHIYNTGQINNMLPQASGFFSIISKLDSISNTRDAGPGSQ